jgi:hypothetical protein
MQAVQRFLTDILSGIDNKTPDIARLLWAISCIAFVFYSGWNVIVNKQVFNAIDFGGGAAGILAGGGIGVASKAATEPQPRTKNSNDPNQ